MEPSFVTIKNSTNASKKLMAIFYNKDKDKIKTVHFGQRGALDYTTHRVNERDERKRLYDLRHSIREDWNNPMTAGSLSKYILWNKPTINESIESYTKKFKIIPLNIHWLKLI